MQIKIYKTIILFVVFYGCETWFVTLRKKHRLRVFGDKALRRIFGPKREEVGETGEDCKMRSFITCTLHQVLLG
jgi:hypothetical protein